MQTMTNLSHTAQQHPNHQEDQHPSKMKQKERGNGIYCKIKGVSISRVLFSLACISGASLASSHKMQYFFIILEAYAIIGSPETVHQTKHTHN